MLFLFFYFLSLFFISCTSSRLTGIDTCGDNILDEGEECDSQSLCCTTNCQFSPYGTICRQSYDEFCDSVDICSGISESCPDIWQPSGTSCLANNKHGKCYQGKCVTFEQQCGMISPDLHDCGSFYFNTCNNIVCYSTTSSLCDHMNITAINGSDCGVNHQCFNGLCQLSLSLESNQYEWYLGGPFTPCTSPCNGWQNLTIFCHHQSSFQKVDDKYCQDIDRPLSFRSCNTSPCLNLTFPSKITLLSDNFISWSYETLHTPISISMIYYQSNWTWPLYIVHNIQNIGSYNWNPFFYDFINISASFIMEFLVNQIPIQKLSFQFLDLCFNNTCSGHGTCINGRCICDSSRYFDDICSSDACFSCQNGHCDEYGICNCENGYRGNYCEISSLCTLICSHNGIIDSECNSCQCKGYWKGSNCNKCSFFCKNGKPNHRCNGCVCFEGYSGIQCEYKNHFAFFEINRLSISSVQQQIVFFKILLIQELTFLSGLLFNQISISSISFIDDKILIDIILKLDLSLSSSNILSTLNQNLAISGILSPYISTSLSLYTFKVVPFDYQNLCFYSLCGWLFYGVSFIMGLFFSAIIYFICSYCFFKTESGPHGSSIEKYYQMKNSPDKKEKE